MPTSEKPLRSDLRVEGPMGMPIQIVDAKFRTVGSGVGRVETNLPEGLYTIRWLGTEPEERDVRLFASDQPMVVKGGGAAADLESITLAGTTGPGSQLQAAKAFHIATAGPSLVVIVVSETGAQLKSDPARSIRLLDAERSEVASWREDGRATPGRVEATLEPGPYLLRYETTGGRVFEQVVTVLRDRQTVVRLSSRRGYVFRGREGLATRRSVRGISPAHTVIVSVPLGSPEVPHRDLSRAATMLRSLAARVPQLDEQLTTLMTRSPDPYMQLYAALGAARVSRQDVAVPWAQPLARRAADRLPPEFGADAAGLSWCLGTGGEHVNITVPSMLAATWAWVSEWSLREPRLVVRNASTEAAGDARSAFLPWLVWAAADVRRAAGAANPPVEPQVDNEAHLRQLIDQILGDGQRGAPSGSASFFEVGSFRSPAADRRGEDALSVESRRFLSDLAHVWTPDSIHDLGRVAGQLGLPAGSFVRRAEDALDEMRAGEAG